MIRKKNIYNRRKGALERLEKIKEPTEKQLKEIETLKQRISLS